MSWARIGLAVVGVLAGLAAAAIMLGNDVRPRDATRVLLVVSVGWSFVVSGLVAWRLQPRNPIGLAMVATGLLRFADAPFWSQDPAVFAIGHVIRYGYMAGLGYVLLAFPSGWLETRVRRGVFIAAVVAAVPLQAAWMLVGGHRLADCAGCPPMSLEIIYSPILAVAFQASQLVVGALAGASAVALLLQRWRSASAPQRFAITPVIWAGAATMSVLVAMLFNHLIAEPLGDLPHLALDLTLAMVAVAFLVGVARIRIARSGVAELVRELATAPSPGGLRAALRRSLRDPSLEVAYWLPDEGHFVDGSGVSIRIPESSARAVTMIERDGQRIAALVHDPAVLNDASLVEAVAAAAGLQLENERLQADLRSELEEVRASRARIVEATQAERRRIERDLHDGTQQRLVSIAMTLGLADSKLPTDPDAALDLLREAKAGTSTTLAELRELSQGIHPGILTERGLGDAIDELAGQLRQPVEVDVRVSQRLPARIESAAYYVVSEALTNVAKHARANRARVRVEHADGEVVIVVSDDGRGGADMGGGSGLRGLRDRVEALGGRLSIDSPTGHGTVLAAAIPCA